MTKGRLRKIRNAEIKNASEEADRTRTLLLTAYEAFNSSSDPGLTEASIYEINALRARYDYALRGVKLKMRCDENPVTETCPIRVCPRQASPARAVDMPPPVTG